MERPASRRAVIAVLAGGGLIAASRGVFATPAQQSHAPSGSIPPHRRRTITFGYGPPVRDPKGLLDLPQGFSYRVVSVANGTPLAHTTLTDGGEPSPSRYDGTGCFSTASGHTLVSNHEISGTAVHPVPHRADYTYDEGAALGGSTTVTTDPAGGRLTEVVSLAGTVGNCAGGKTPWNTWLSCEESERTAGSSLAKDHGYVFEVDPFNQDANRNPVPIKALGRFPHEAVVVDPASHAIYMTEDVGSPNGLLYRWTSNAMLGNGALRALPATAGTLAAMYCTDSAGRYVSDLSVASKRGTTYRVTWKAVPDRDARETSTRKQFNHLVKTSSGSFSTVKGPGGPITSSRKLEGMWWGRGGFYFDASFARTSDGSRATHNGQVWFYDVSKSTITLVTFWPYSSDVDNVPGGADNLTVSPWGGLMICEDGSGTNHLVMDDLKGSSAIFARNRLDSEVAGATFSGDGKTLFVNSQDPSMMFAVTGPWGQDWWSRVTQ